MTDCKCLTSTYRFLTYKKPTKWYHKIPFFDISSPTDTKVITINGETLEEIEKKKNDIKKSLEKKYGKKYEVYVWVN